MNFFDNNMPFNPMMINPNAINEMNYKLNEMDNRIKKIEQRINRLENNKITNNYSNDHDENIYMI